MTDYIVGSDHSGGKDQECINKIIEVLKSNGHNAESIGVNSNLESDIRRNGKGKTAIFMVNGICIGTFDSHMNVVKSGLCDYVWFAIPQSISPSNDWLSPESCQSKKLPIAHDDNFTPEPRRSELNGKYTLSEYCEEYKDYVGYACGKDCEEAANAILSGGTVGSGGSGSDGEGSDGEKKEPSPMSYADMIKDLIKVWDGDVEVKIRQNMVFINKVPQPKPELWIIDGNNVASESAKVTDYNSDTINMLDVNYDNGSKHIIITDEYLINRFGEMNAELKAEKIVTNYQPEELDSGEETGESGGADANLYTQIAEILQKYYTVQNKEDWNTIINKVRFAETGDAIGNIVASLTKKQGMETQSYVSVRHEIEKLRGMGY